MNVNPGPWHGLLGCAWLTVGLRESECMHIYLSAQMQQIHQVELLLFNCQVMSNSLRPHGLQHAWLLCPSFFQSLLKLMSIESVMTSNHLILCHPLLLLPSLFPSIRLFSNELALPIRWPKYWNFSFSIHPSNESVQFSPVIQLCLHALHGPKHARPPCPSPTPGVYSNSCPLSR